MYSIQNYTTFSFFSGTMEPKEWAEQAAALGYDAIGITDKQTTGGWVELQNACDKHDVQPIFGEEFIVVEDVKEKVKTNEGVLLLYAMNEVGYKNLVGLNNFAQARDGKGGFYYRPRIDMEIVEGSTEGIICVIPCVDGYGTQLSGSGFKYPERLLDVAEKFEYAFFGYNPLVDPESKYAKINRASASMKSALPRIFTFNCHTTKEEYRHLQTVVNKIAKGKRNAKCLPRDIHRGWLPTNKEVQSSCDEDVYLECVSSLARVKELCKYRIPLGEYHMPEAELLFDSLEEDILYLLGEGFKAKLNPSADFDKLESLEQLREYADGYPHESLVRRQDSEENLKPLSEYVDQLEYEFNIIEELGYQDYFKLVWDFCKKNDEMGETRGYARGSAAGSLFSYLLNITRIDPIRHGLIFERFLNPDRNDLPDIDLDFSSKGRDKIKDYIKERYGADSVVSIGTYDRFKIASAIKSVARAYNYGIPDDEGNIIQYTAKSLNGIMSNLSATATARGRQELEEFLEYDTFKEFYEQHTNWVEKTIMPLLETVSAYGVHPAGMLILPTPVDETMFIYSHGSGRRVTQWKDRYCEARGFPKFDILGITNLDIIESAKELVREQRGVEIPMFEDISFQDEKAMKLLASGDTQGIFQLQSFLGRNFLPKLKPTKFEHIVATESLLRKGPMAADAHTIFRQIINGEREAEYEHPDLRESLEETVGLIVYQEQMMDIVRVIGGLTNSQADYVRKACGKKNLEEMQKWESVFKEGGLENGYSEDLLDSLWEKIVAFAEYSFNKSHAVSYSALSYYQAWIKARYPLEYWCAVLQHSKQNKRSNNSVYQVKAKAETHGINFIYPSIEGFSTKFSPASDSDIYWPISVISGFGPRAIKEVEKIGRNSFESMREMMEILPSRYVTKSCYINLIRAGFFDPIGPPWEMMEEFFKLRVEFDFPEEEVPFEYRHQNKFRWALEKRDSFGVMTKPWKDIAPFHKKCRAYTTKQLESIPDGGKAFIGGYIEELWTNVTKYGDWYAKIKIVDTDEKHLVMAWSDFWSNPDLDKPLNSEGEIDEINGRRRRPKRGDLVEMIVEKGTWSERHQLTLGEPNQYVRVVWTEEEIETE